MCDLDIESDTPGYGTMPGVVDGILGNTPYGLVQTQCQVPTRALLSEFIQNMDGGSFVEIGIFGGASQLSTYDLCMSKGMEVYGIDPFEDINIFNGKSEEDTHAGVAETARNAALGRRLALDAIIKKNNLRINILKKTSTEAVTMFNDGSISVLHVDGDHSYDGVTNDLNNYWTKIRSGGVIINDDYDWPCCRKAIDEFVRLKGAEIRESYDASNHGPKHVIVKR